ncbi:MAG: RNA 2',3'-cyclic phosphodiesterase [Candidatus Nanoarchaeia archaeon]
MRRTFIGIEIPEKVKEEIDKIQKQLPEFMGKFTEKKNLHVTLKFLGEIDEDKILEVKKRLKEIKFSDFEAKLDKIGFFDNTDRGVVWVNITNCEKLQKEIDKKLEGLFQKEKRFMGHLTIARTKYIKNKREFLEKLDQIKISHFGFNIGEFDLKESVLTGQKHVYINLEKYKLI